MKIAIANARLAFPNIFRPRTPEGSEKAKYGASLIIPPNHPAVAQINAAIEAVAKEKWTTKAPAILAGLKAQDKTCLHDGATKSQYDGFDGNLFVSASSDARPLIIGRNKEQLTEGDGKPYAGCYVNANIEVWAQDNKYGKRVNAQLRGVQFVKDGDAFAAGSPASEDEFADLGEEAEVDPTA